MLYTSLKQIKEDFQLESNDIVILRDQLNQVRTELHPDKNNGDFKNNTEKERYYKVSEAVAYIDSLKESNQLIVVEKLANLLESFSDIIPNKRESSLQNNLESRINSAIEGYKSLFFPKISLTAIT
ncbi:MAG TPA: hypothetical protein VN703_05270, partial [Candidatus Sulfopaludibacter sp.]|nr:hypothetical protein [Candidatus Sulfopaludibacter sp.]